MTAKDIKTPMIPHIRPATALPLCVLHTEAKIIANIPQMSDVDEQLIISIGKQQQNEEEDVTTE